MSVDQGAEAIVNLIVKAFVDDIREYALRTDLETYIRQHIVSIVTDGASTFIGENTGVTTRLSQRFTTTTERR